MSDPQLESLRFVLRILANRMADTRRQEEDRRKAFASGADPDPLKPGVVLVLGAGCSMQYGLPGFVDLLRYAFEDLNPHETLDEKWGLESLRDRLDRHWRAAKPEELRTHLERYLRRIRGNWCTGYLRLARMARKGYIRAIVNMNFDTLLEEAFSVRDKPEAYPRAGVWHRRYWVSRSFQFDVLTKGPERCQKCPERSADGRLRLVIYKPHGSLRIRRGVPILDLASSDLFDNENETRAANDLFRNNDVVFLGYSGADAKIVASLSPEEAPTDLKEAKSKNYNQIFVLNVNPPDPRLLRVMVARRSTELNVVGYAAAFENVMEQLEGELTRLESTDPQETPSFVPNTLCSDPEDDPHSQREDARDIPAPFALPTSTHFTAAETTALEACRQCAIELRSRLNIAESGRISIEKHGADLFNLSLLLARSAGIGLTNPEKFLLHCAGYLHDLGYFWAHSSSRKNQKFGWRLLTTHGEDTETLLRKPPTPERLRTALPSTYDSDRNSDQFLEWLIYLCRHHSGFPHGPRKSTDGTYPRGVKSRSLRARQRDPNLTVRIGGFPIPVRLDLLHAVFSTAEELSQGHPFFPSPYAIEGSTLPEEKALEDPVLDIYLRCKQDEIEFKYRRERVVACAKRPTEDGEPTDTFLLLATMAQNAVQELDKIVRKQGTWGIEGWGIGFLSNSPLLDTPTKQHGTQIGRLLRNALAHQLRQHLNRLREACREPSAQIGLVPSVVDLIALYTDPIYSSTGAKGTKLLCRLEKHKVIREAFDLVETIQPSKRKRLLHRFIEIITNPTRMTSQGPAYNSMEDLFKWSFSHIYRPAWRFCADKWLNGIDALVMARASLDFGSSRFRDELAVGLKDLVEDKISWARAHDLRRRWRREGDAQRWKVPKDELWAFGHDGCTVCASRLLYVYATVRRLLPSPELREPFRDQKARSLDDAVRAILLYMVRKPEDDPAWWGIEEQQRRAEQDDRRRAKGDRKTRSELQPSAERTLYSADYVGWALRALVQVLSVEAEIRQATGKSWIEDECRIQTAEVYRLFEKVWRLVSSLGLRYRKAPTNIKELLSQRAEEPYSYIVGHLAIACLSLLDLHDEMADLPDSVSWLRPLRQLIKTPIDHLVSASGVPDLTSMVEGAVIELEQSKPAQLSRFFAWPAYVLLARTESDGKRCEKWESILADLLEECLKSRVWILQGEGRGSWGYNIENTQRIVTSLSTCWHYCFAHSERMAPLVASRFSHNSGWMV